MSLLNGCFNEQFSNPSFMANKRTKILHLEPARYNDECRKHLSELGDVSYYDVQTQTELEQILHGSDASCLFVRLGINVSRRIVESMPQLKCVITPTTGHNHIDESALRQNGIALLSLRGEHEFLKSIRSTAEHTWALLLACVRQVPTATDSVANGQWQRSEFVGVELFEKTLGVVGMGRLGTLVAGYALAFGMNVVYCDVRPDDQIEAPFGATRSSLTELLNVSDIITLHLPYNQSTHQLIGAREFAAMKQGAYLVNTSRGEVVDETALLTQLSNKRLAGVALDVLDGDSSWGKELPSNHWLREKSLRNRLIVTPHIGGYAQESIERTRLFMVEKLRRHLGISENVYQ